MRISVQSRESCLPASPSRRALRQRGTSCSSDAAGNVPTSPSSSAVKEEPCDVDEVLILWETSQQEAELPQEDGDTQENKTPAENRNVSHFYFSNTQKTPPTLPIQPVFVWNVQVSFVVLGLLSLRWEGVDCELVWLIVKYLLCLSRP